MDPVSYTHLMCIRDRVVNAGFVAGGSIHGLGLLLVLVPLAGGVLLAAQPFVDAGQLKVHAGLARIERRAPFQFRCGSGILAFTLQQATELIVDASLIGVERPGVLQQLHGLFRLG